MRRFVAEDDGEVVPDNKGGKGEQDKKIRCSRGEEREGIPEESEEEGGGRREKEI